MPTKKSKPPSHDASVAVAVSDNGHNHAHVIGGPGEFDLAVVLMSLQSMRDGDFSVRLPGSWTGLGGKIADTFNDIVAANQQMARELRRVGQSSARKAALGNAPASTKVAALGARWKAPSILSSKISFARLPK